MPCVMSGTDIASAAARFNRIGTVPAPTWSGLCYAIGLWAWYAMSGADAEYMVVPGSVRCRKCASMTTAFWI
eukprot:3874521-Rhodomonas_salina.2